MLILSQQEGTQMFVLTTARDSMHLKEKEVYWGEKLIQQHERELVKPFHLSLSPSAAAGGREASFCFCTQG